MTEQEWLECGDPSLMLHQLWPDDQCHVIERFYVACCRQIWTVITDQRSRSFVEILESSLDGTATKKELQIAREQAKKALRGGDVACWIIYAATSTVWHRHFTGMLNKKNLIPYEDQCAILRDIVPYLRPVTVDPAWRTSTVVSLAQAIYAERAFDRLPILADALEDAGCTNPDILNHCRQPGEHVRGCWCVDLVLSKS